jgi:hypothetical protein
MEKNVAARKNRGAEICKKYKPQKEALDVF